MISAYDKENMENILCGHGDWFTAQLLRLMAKADGDNFARLAEVFPFEAAAYLDWREGVRS